MSPNARTQRDCQPVAALLFSGALPFLFLSLDPMTRLKYSPATATTTPIAAGDDHTQYDAFSILLDHGHSGGEQIVLAHTWGFASKSTRHLMIVGHMSFGVMLSAVLIVRSR
ncbi:hypothetical protein AB3X94_28475 [Paraburkholderia sp. BR10923]|uniref:hypothetical protein n=1 Tax=Paraburkholderia TaxID=1822464 RepID=UPI001FE27480|nr:hypothetical protein [Paraburkholderia youngii]